MKAFIKNTAILIVMLTQYCCVDNKTKISEVSTSFTGSNVLDARVHLHTNQVRNVFIKYQMVGRHGKPYQSTTSVQKRDHNFLLPALKPGQRYVFDIVTSGGNFTDISRDYFFTTMNYSGGVLDTFKVLCADTAALPAAFKKGYVMVHQREAPGIIVLLNSKGDVVWHYRSEEAGFKVVHFTKDQTFLSILGTIEYETSYGSAILELSLKGDTLLYLKKGQNDFQQTIHHEIFYNSQNEIVTLCVEDRIIDLRSKGGIVKDTVRGDGILVLDRQGRKRWKWTVFDVLNPLQDDNILQTKKDWMHANSVSIDKDGHYLISFYNNGQIWKVHAVTGRVIWKFGKGGNLNIPPGAKFDQAHAVHIDDRGWIHFF